MKEKNRASLKIKDDILDKVVEKPLQREEWKETSHGDWWNKHCRWEKAYGKYQGGDSRNKSIWLKEQREIQCGGKIL